MGCGAGCGCGCGCCGGGACCDGWGVVTLILGHWVGGQSGEGEDSPHYLKDEPILLTDLFARAMDGFLGRRRVGF